jgi:hypothetical protein
MREQNRSWLLIVSDRAALAWVLKEQRMAFGANRARAAQRLRVGDLLFLYATRGCFHNPTRDRGRIIGAAQVATEARYLDRPVRIVGREFPIGCELEISELAPLNEGIELAPLVPQLKVFPNPRGWSALIRKPLLELPRVDTRLLEKHLDRVVRPAADVLEGYVRAAS